MRKIFTIACKAYDNPVITVVTNKKMLWKKITEIMEKQNLSFRDDADDITSYSKLIKQFQGYTKVFIETASNDGYEYTYEIDEFEIK